MNSNPAKPTGPLPSSDENAGYFSPPLGWGMQMAGPSIRERAFDAAQRLVLSDPYAPTRHLAQNRVVERILELAGKFEEWMAQQPRIDLRTALSDEAQGTGNGENMAAERPSVVCGMDMASKSELVSLTIVIRPVGLTEAMDSLQSLQAALRSDKLSDASVERIKALFNLASVDFSDLAAFGADKLALHLQPSKQYLGCVAALSARDVERHVVRVEFIHGWPILSVVSRVSTVAEGAAPSKAAPEGAQ